MPFLKSKIAILISFLFMFPIMGFAQVITTDPVFPTFDQPLTIYFDATEADNQSLVGYTGNLYAHTGTILTQGANWSNVIGSWGNNSTQPQLENIGENLWKLEIGNISEFYDLPSSVENVHELAMVFREATASLGGGSWRQTEDLFVTIYDEAVSVLFITPNPDPLNPYFGQIGEEVNVEVAANVGESELESFQLFVNDEEVVSTDELSISYTLNLQETGRTTLRARAENTDGLFAEETVFVTVNPDVVNENRPAGIEDGITYHEDNTKVMLSLWAPEKDFVYVIGDFNDWEVDPDYFMKRETNGDNVHYWLEIDGLTPGEEYAFQYLIDGDLRMADLYSEKVLSPWNDQYISNSTYPNLKPYPHDFTTEMVTVIQPGKEEFNWTDDNYERPAPGELVVYELLIRDFLEDETYKSLADTLDYLERLGVNAIELMPVANFDGNDSWGYNPNFHLALDKAYGPAHEFKRFVNDAHNRGIAVILDVVYNHATGQSPLVRLYGTGASNNPLLGNGHEFNVFNHLNHNHPYIQYWLDRVSKHWLEEYRVDGFRFDLTKGFANNFNSSNYGGYNSQRIGNLKRMADEIWNVDPNAYIILEHFTANSEETELANHRRGEGRQGMMFWGNVNNPSSEASMGYHNNNQSDFRGMYYKTRGWNMPNLIGYMESHDEQWLMLKNRKFGNSSGSYNIRDLSTALERQKLVGAFFLSNPGPKMLWQFGELGYGGGEGECLKPGGDSNGDCLASDPDRTGRKPIRWEYRDDPDRFRLYQTWQWILKARHENPVFHSSDTNVQFHDFGSSTKVMALAHSSMDAIVMGNFGVQNADVNPRFTQTGTWYDYFTGESIEIGDGQQENTLLLAPGEFRIYTTQLLETPPSGLIGTSIDDEFLDEIPSKFNLHQNYPNPFNPTTSIRFDVAEATQVNLTVYNILGQQVATLVNDVRSAGSYTVNFDATRLSSGTYFVRMQAGNNIFTNKMLLVK